MCAPEDDPYLGSFKDKTFKPTQKIILGVYGTPEECINAEVNLHAFFEVDINPHFANLARQTSTGFVSLVKTKEHRENISKGLTGRKLSPESIAKRQAKRVYATGEDHHMVKRGHTPETKAVIKEKRALQMITEETRRKISNSLKGRVFSPEHREKLSESTKGGPGRPGARSEEERLKTSESVKKSYENNKWQCLVTGFVSTAQGLSNYQRSRGIDKSLRVKIDKLS